MLELVFTEDHVKYEQYEDACTKRLAQLSKLKSAEALFVQAELRVQWAFIYLQFGHEFDAAWNIRQAYLLAQECKKKFPGFQPIKKTAGVLEVMLATVPEKYQWVINLFSMSGNVDKGLEQLNELRQTDTSLAFETSLIYYLVQSFILQQTSAASVGMDGLIEQYPNNRLALFFAGNIALKNSESEKALAYFTTLQQHTDGLPLRYTDYHKAEVYLHKGHYGLAIEGYQTYIQNYTGNNYIKDAWYKTGVCYALQDQPTEANRCFEKAKTAGSESTEADRYAARSLADNAYPNSKFSKIRYATDGGYYAEAEAIIQTVTADDLKTLKEKTEFVYRKARLYHKTNALAEAKNNYRETIATAGAENWYFAPNACLQLGYIFIDENNTAQARAYFQQALSYPKHEYKNSIDSKAKSALVQLEETGNKK